MIDEPSGSSDLGRYEALNGNSIIQDWIRPRHLSDNNHRGRFRQGDDRCHGHQGDEWSEPPLPLDTRADGIYASSMTLKEAAAHLGVTADNLRMQIKNGKLTGRKIGRDWHVTAREVARYRSQNLGRWYRRSFEKDGFNAVLFRIMPSARDRSLDIRGIVALAANRSETLDELALRISLDTESSTQSTIKLRDFQVDTRTKSIRMRFE